MHPTIANLRKLAEDFLNRADRARAAGQEKAAEKETTVGLVFLESALRRQRRGIACPKCARLVGRFHVCPRRYDCVHCGEPSDVFVANPHSVDATFDPDELAKPRKHPLCDACLYERLTGARRS
jgi:hypothetical protein